MKAAVAGADLAELKRLTDAKRAAQAPKVEEISTHRAKFFSSVSKDLQFLELTNWAVCGDVLNAQMPASTVVSSLRRDGKTVHLVNPHDTTCTCSKELLTIAAPIDVVNLCINSWNGMHLAKQAAQLGVSKCFIQPGVRPHRHVYWCTNAFSAFSVRHIFCACEQAESPELLQFLHTSGIDVYQGCVMVELGRRGR